MKGDFYYFKALGEYGVPPWRVYTLLKDKLKLRLRDLEVIERCYRVDTPDKTCYLYSMDAVQDLIYTYENDVSIKIDSQNIWFQMCQRMKDEVEK